MGYTTLIGDKSTAGSIKAWVNHGAIPSESIVAEAEAWIYERLRVRQMMNEQALTFAVGDDSLDLSTLDPAFLDPISLTLDGDSMPLDYVHEQLFAALRTRDDDGDLTDGRPGCWSIIGDDLLFDTAFDEETGAILWYYGPLPALSASNDTNFLTRRYPTLLRHVCMAYGYEFLKRTDDKMAEFALAEKELAEANFMADRARRGQVF